MYRVTPQIYIKTFLLLSYALRLRFSATCDKHYKARPTLLAPSRTKDQSTFIWTLHWSVEHSFRRSRTSDSQDLSLILQNLSSAGLSGRYVETTVFQNVRGYVRKRRKPSHIISDDAKLWLQPHFVKIVRKWRTLFVFHPWLRLQKREN